MSYPKHMNGFDSNYYGEQIQEDEMGEACSTRARDEKYMTYEGVSKSFRIESITKYALTFGITR